jgi:hypothetical protein
MSSDEISHLEDSALGRRTDCLLCDRSGCSETGPLVFAVEVIPHRSTGSDAGGTAPVHCLRRGERSLHDAVRTVWRSSQARTFAPSTWNFLHNHVQHLPHATTSASNVNNRALAG